MPQNQGKAEVADPKSLKERMEVAGACVKDLGITMPALVDDMADTANLAYAGWPERLYVIGKDGKIAYAGGMGPFKFNPKECEAFLKEHLAKPENCKEKEAEKAP